MKRGFTRSLALSLALVLLPPRVFAQPVPEYELKAAFIYNFALFTDWPAEVAFDGGILNICVNSYSALREPLAGLGEKLVKGKRIVIRRTSALDNLRSCHVLFLDNSDREHWKQIKQALSGASVLTVSDDEEIGHDGSVIALVTQSNRIVFDIDLNAAGKARLVLSSKLLRLARTVQ